MSVLSPTCMMSPMMELKRRSDDIRVRHSWASGIPKPSNRYLVHEKEGKKAWVHVCVCVCVCVFLFVSLDQLSNLLC